MSLHKRNNDDEFIKKKFTQIDPENVKHSLQSIARNRHERQKEWPQAVVTGSNNNLKQSVQSKSSLCSGFPRHLWVKLATAFSNF